MTGLDLSELAREARSRCELQNGPLITWFLQRVALETEEKNRTNLVEAYKFAMHYDGGLSFSFLCKLNAIILGQPHSSSKLRSASAFSFRRHQITCDLTRIPLVHPTPGLLDRALRNLIIKYQTTPFSITGKQDVKDVEAAALQDALHVATEFTARFLFLKPFAFGNGRTARVLFSWLLNSFVPGPIPLLGPSQDYAEATKVTAAAAAAAAAATTVDPLALFETCHQSKDKRRFSEYTSSAVENHLREILSVT